MEVCSTVRGYSVANAGFELCGGYGWLTLFFFCDVKRRLLCGWLMKCGLLTMLSTVFEAKLCALEL